MNNQAIAIYVLCEDALRGMTSLLSKDLIGISNTVLPYSLTKPIITTHLRIT